MASPQRTRSTGGRAAGAQRAKAETSHGPTLHLPGVTAEFHRPDLHVPSRQDLDNAVSTARRYLPPPDQLTYYAGLGLVAALGVIEWPVAAAIGIGTAMTGRAAR
ncbi:hypothetical protein GCM10011581_44010 [Saccharopolyspora subtropica]|uniref:Uncharacterized protein n=1 Tax=Saccharopolyspora thermophila TaxID=89367 RepID=A0A917K5S1_9PSEU|nr:hypothetical protein [Saccharopolyspora subtropica]GGJ02009.1 hypothetical protein GCM10011581_44010 [Saccharopolyspora subtropica]